MFQTSPLNEDHKPARGLVLLSGEPSYKNPHGNSVECVQLKTFNIRLLVLSFGSAFCLKPSRKTLARSVRHFVNSACATQGLYLIGYCILLTNQVACLFTSMQQKFDLFSTICTNISQSCALFRINCVLSANQHAEIACILNNYWMRLSMIS